MPIYEYECDACGRESSILFRSISRAQEAEPACEHCGSASLQRVISAPAPMRSRGALEQGALRKANPRKAVENMSRQYDSAGIDPGDGFDEVARRAAAGDDPETLKAAVQEAKRNEAASSSSNETKSNEDSDT